MSCFSCGIHRPKVGRRPIDSGAGTQSFSRIMDALEYERAPTLPEGNSSSSNARRLTFQELAAATQNFREANLIGQGGFGKVFKGRLESDMIVAIKQLNREGHQGSKEFLVEVLMLSMLHHPNLVSLIGYCSEGYERLLVYEYMPHGSLDHHLFDLPPVKEPLGWNTRMKIAVGAAKGLTHLHETNPPVIYRDLKSANILLDDEFNPKLSDFGLAKLGPVGDKTHVSTRVMGTYGYCAPDYATSGKLTVKSDVYSFGVVLLELMTGRMVYDISKKEGEQYLITWSRPFLSNRRRVTQLADPLLQGCYPHRPFHQLSEITALCLREQPHSRPAMREVADALIHVASQPYVPDADRKIRRDLPP